MARRGWNPVWRWSSLLALLLAAPVIKAEDKSKAEAKPPQPAPQPLEKKQVQPLPEADFLEFLASWDDEDEEWTEYLAEHMESAQQAAKGTATPQTVKKVESK